MHTRIMKLGAIPAGGWPGSGGPAPSMNYGDPAPPWFINFNRQPPPTPSFPQNPPRVTTKRMTPGFVTSSGDPIYSVVNGVRNAATLGALGANGENVYRSDTARALWGAASIAGTGLGAYHGYKRTKSAGWALGWGLFGAVVPIIALPVMFAQGFGKRK